MAGLSGPPQIASQRQLNDVAGLERTKRAVRPVNAALTGKLEFYLEALDTDIRKPHENPAIGLLLCATKAP